MNNITRIPNMGARGFGGGVSNIFLSVVVVLLLLMILAGVIYLIIRVNKIGKCVLPSTDSNALNLLNERFAKGEITEEEYKNAKQTLQH
jgi:putative membrane protein